MDIFLEEQQVKMETTFTSLQSQKCVRLTNRSDIIAKFEWKHYSTAMEEEEQRLGKTVVRPPPCIRTVGLPG